MFSGTFSFFSPAPSSGTSGMLVSGGSGSGGITGTAPISGGGITGTAPTGSSWSFNTGDGFDSGGGGFIYTAPASYQTGYSYNYQSPLNAYGLPGAGLRAGPFGDRGPYTPLDFPLMRELTPGERLESLNPQSGSAGTSVLPYLALGIIAALLLK